MVSVQQTQAKIGYEPVETLVSRLCDRMEAAGWLRRVPSATDRRVKGNLYFPSTAPWPRRCWTTPGSTTRQRTWISS